MMKQWRWCAALAIALAARGAIAAEMVDVTVDKGTLLRLDTNAKVVLVAEPGIADAVIESPRLIFILGRRPGETNLYVLDATGREILTADVVVRPDKSAHVSVHRSTREATLSCAPRCASVETPGLPLEVHDAGVERHTPRGRGEARPSDDSSAPQTGGGQRESR
jgi:hypothetical protein